LRLNGATARGGGRYGDSQRFEQCFAWSVVVKGGEVEEIAEKPADMSLR